MSVLSLLLAVTASNGYFDQSTDALKTNVGLTGECKLRNPQKIESLDNCTDAHFALIVGLTGACKTSVVSSASKSVTPVSVKHSSSVNPVPSSLHR